MKVVVVDDSILFRKVLADALASLPGVEVVGTASNGKIALQKIRELTPDLITLDIEMPEMDGLAVLDAMQKEKLVASVIVVSAQTKVGSRMTMQALEKGAFDFITKPDASSPEENRAAILKELIPRVRALASRHEIRSILKSATGASSKTGSTAPASQPVSTRPVQSTPEPQAASTTSTVFGTPAGKPDMVLIGVSTGGPNALAKLLPQLPKNMGVPILIVQHMPPVFTQSLAESLASKCALEVHEAVHGESLKPDTIYIAPGGRQMRITPNGAAKTIEITDDPPENNCRPAVDYLFRSAASKFPGKSMGVILTGMGSDGTLGLRLLKRHGCFIIAQDEPSCVVFGMPKAAIEAGIVDAILPLDQIASKIVSTVKGLRA